MQKVISAILQKFYFFFTGHEMSNIYILAMLMHFVLCEFIITRQEFNLDTFRGYF